jgi:ectoine hydroxylase-related dioxygenase (phytanoyl-CoA dioxygenase family)
LSIITPGHRNDGRSKGFTVVRDAVEPGLADAWRAELAVLVAQQRAAITERTAVDDYMVHNPMVSNPIFYGVLEHPAVVAALDAFLTDTSLVYAFTTSSMPAGGSNYSRRVHVDCPRVIPGYITNLGVIIALDDFTVDNGATYFLPRSFEQLDAPTEEEFFADAERVFPKRGDLVVFNARTFHYGGLNSTDDDRHALTINACRSYMRQRFDYPRLIGEEAARSFSPTLRRLLGYDVRVPATLEEYYLPEDQRLYKANQG